MALYDPTHAPTGRLTSVAYVEPGYGFDRFLDEHPRVLVSRTTYEEALRQFRSGAVDAVIQELQPTEPDAHTITLLLPDSEVRTTMLVAQFKDMLRDYERQLRAERSERILSTVVYVDVPAPATTYHGFAYGVLLPLLLVVPVFLAGSITADSLTQELETKTMELLRATPVSGRQILAGKLLTPVLLAPVQALAWFALLRLNGAIVHHVVPLLLLTTAFALFLACTSIYFALAVRRQGETQLAYGLFLLMLLSASLLLHPTPFNLIARLAIGHAGAEEAFALAVAFFLALASLLGILAWAPKRLARVPP